MRQISAGTPQTIDTYTRAYTQFRGVDFSTDSTQVDLSRSPSSKNMISDTAGFPEKRPGWRYLFKQAGEVHNLFAAVFADGTSGLYAHIGTKLYKWTEPDEDTLTEGTMTEIANGLADRRSVSFSFDGKVYILDGTKYRVLAHDEEIDGYVMKDVTDDEPYVPTVRISITGDQVTQIGNSNEYFGGHTYQEYEQPNILTHQRKCTMCGDGASKTFFLPEEDVESVDEVTVNGAEVTAYTLTAKEGKIKFTTAPAIDPDGAGLANIEVKYTCRPKKYDEVNHEGDGTEKEFETKAGIACINMVKVGASEKKEGTDYSVDTETGIVTFTTAPADGKNVYIRYAEWDTDKDIDRINECTLVESFGYYNDNRWFVTGVQGEEYKNIDYMSGSGDPTYFPYDGYVRVGADTSRIVGYLKQYDSLLIVKEDNEQDAQVFMRTASYDDEDGAMFPVQQGIRGVGAAGREAFGVLRDDPMFLSDEGVFAITGTAVKEQQTMQNRSFYVNKKLMAEEHLENACAGVSNGYFLLAVNGHCYVADSRQQTAASDTGAYGYEWYYWENFPAVLMWKIDKALYFSTNTERAHEWRYAEGTQTYAVPRDLMTWEGLYKNGELQSVNSYSIDTDAHTITLANTMTAGDELKLVWRERGICRMNTDYERMVKYSDGAWPMMPYSRMSAAEKTAYDALTDNSNRMHYRRTLNPGVAIEAVWTTKADTLDTIVNLKNVPKKGCAIIIKPYTRSSIDIGYLTNREGTKSIKEVQADIFDFNDVDFERITFNTIDMPQVIALNRKIKKFNIVQFIIKSTAKDEGFGLYGIQISYTIGRYVK